MSLSDHQSIQHQMFRIKHTELNEIFLVMSLRSFVCSMIAIFIPIYLYNLGYSLRDVMMTNLIMFSVQLVLEYFAVKVRTDMGPKHAIALSLPFLIAHFWLFSTISLYHWPLWFPALCGGITLALYWQGYNYDFSKSKHKGGATKDVSTLYILIAVLGAVAPFIGSVVVTKFGFAALYMTVILALAVVFIPLLRQGEPHVKKEFRFGNVKICEITRDLVSYGGSGMEASIALVVWPLFVYFMVKNYESVGFITTIALIVTIASTYYVGRKVDNSNRHRFIQTSSYFESITYTLLVFVNSVFQVASLNLARSLATSLRQAPFVSEYYIHADERSRSEYIFYMESAIDVFRILMFAALVGLTFVFDNKIVLIAGLILGALGALMTSLMPRAKCEIPVCKDATIRVTPKLRSARETNR